MIDPHHHEPGNFARIALFLLGVDPERAAWAGRDDQAHMRLLALSLTLLFAWVGFNTAHALTVATGQPYLSPEVMIWSPLLAGLYVVVDRALLRGRYWSMGVALARERGFDVVPRTRWQVIADGLGALPFTLMRLGLALTVAAFCAFSFGLWFWERDITAQLHTDHMVANANLRTRIEGEIARDIADFDRRIAQIVQRIEARTAAAERARDEAMATQARMRERALSEVAAVDTRLSALQVRIDCAQTDVDAERDGGTDCRGIPRAAGRQARFNAAVADLERLQAHRPALLAERASALDAVRAVPIPAAIEADPEEARHRTLQGQRAEMIATRGEAVAARVQADPAFIPPADGPILRQRTLLKLALDEPVLLALMAVIYTMFLLLELSVVAIAFGRGPASIYALRQVTEFEVRAADQHATARTEIARAGHRTAAAEAERLKAELAVIRAEAEFNAEVRRLAMIDTLLDRTAAGPTADPPRPQFDA